MIGKPGDAGNIQRGGVFIFYAEEPSLVLKADNDAGVGKDLVFGLAGSFLDGKRPDKGLERV